MNESNEAKQVNTTPTGPGRRISIVVPLLAVVLMLPALLSPTHPIGVYAYLAHIYLFPVAAAEDHNLRTELARFLIGPKQLSRYRSDLRDDMLDERGGGLFVVVRDSGGGLRHESLRTWNSFLSADLPPSVRTWLDRKEFPFLGDTVGLWLGGDDIVAMGHYHPFGGGPSAGDRQAQALSQFAEVVVSNGVVPTVYLQGDIVPYGRPATLSSEVFKNLTALEQGLLMEINEVPTVELRSSDGLESFLAYLRDYRKADLGQRDSVAREVNRLFDEFKAEYQMVFQQGFRPFSYLSEPDKYLFLRNLMHLERWANRHDPTTEPLRLTARSVMSGVDGHLMDDR